MRCVIGNKKVKKLCDKTGLPILTAMTRGGTGHRIDLCLSDGSMKELYPDGSIEDKDMRWNIDGWKKSNK